MGIVRSASVSELLISYGFARGWRESTASTRSRSASTSMIRTPKRRLKSSETWVSVETFPLRLNSYPRQLLQYASFILCNPEKPSELQSLAKRRSPAVQTLDKPSSTLWGWPRARAGRGES